MGKIDFPISSIVRKIQGITAGAVASVMSFLLVPQAMPAQEYQNEVLKRLKPNNNICLLADYEAKNTMKPDQKSLETITQGAPVIINKSTSPYPAEINIPDQNNPQYLEQVAKPNNGKHKKFPVLAVVGGIIVLGAVAYLVTKKKSTPTPPVQKVTLNIDVYNHTQAKLLDDYKITVDAGSAVNLTKAMLNVNGVKSEYLILRKLHVGETPGVWVADTNSGTLTTTAPNSNTDYDLFLLNDSDTSYAQYWGSSDTGKTEWRFYRQDFDQTGPDAPLNDGILYMDKCLDKTSKTGMRYGKITRIPTGTQTSGDTRFGYSTEGGAGVHAIADNYWSVNSEKNHNDTSKYMTAVSEGGELVTRSNNFILVGATGWETKYTDAMCMKFLRVKN